jgi:hypothetical protein
MMMTFLCLILLTHIPVGMSFAFTYSLRQTTQRQTILRSRVFNVDYDERDIKAMNTTLKRMLLYSAALGPCLDNYHGLFGVLNYKEGIPIMLEFYDHVVLKTAAWVPPLFGFAGIIMAILQILLDRSLKTKASIRDPNWSKVFYNISFFSFQYYLSGLLDYSNVDNLSIHITLALMAMFGWYIFDTSIAGILLGLATSIAGPFAEIVLINNFNLYTYTHADILGICSWIPWVYFLGGSAVGNLARRVFNDELESAAV